MLKILCEFLYNKDTHYKDSLFKVGGLPSPIQGVWTLADLISKLPGDFLEASEAKTPKTIEESLMERVADLKTCLYTIIKKQLCRNPNLKILKISGLLKSWRKVRRLYK